MTEPAGWRRLGMQFAAAALTVLVLVIAVSLVLPGGGVLGADGPEAPVERYLEAWKDGDCERMSELNPGWLGDGTLQGCEEILSIQELRDYEIAEVEVDRAEGTALVTAELTQVVSGDNLGMTATFRLREEGGEWDFVSRTAD